MSSTEAPAVPVVLWEDDGMAVVLKPAGVPAQADPSGDADMLALLALHWPSRKQTLRAVHRLDRPVSGCMLVAWDPAMVAALSKAFSEGAVRKTYRAIVEGHVAATVVLEHRAAHDARKHVARRLPADAMGGRLLRLSLGPLAHGDRYTLVEVVPEGGAYHQIRAQLAWEGHPIKGDVKYGARRGSPDRSIALHAHAIAFTHPATGRAVQVEAPAPEAMPWPSLLALVGDKR